MAGRIMTLDVIHDTEGCRFTVSTEAGQSYISYRPIDARTVDFDHTFVQPANRGSKVGISLVSTAVAWAQQAGFPCQASCWYVAKYLDKQQRRAKKTT